MSSPNAPEPNPSGFDRWLDDFPEYSLKAHLAYSQAWGNGWQDCHQMMNLEKSRLEIQSAMVMRCCVKAIHRLERNGLKRDAQTIRDELTAMGIELQIIPDSTVEGN
jgi:hypothetical protein